MTKVENGKREGLSNPENDDEVPNREQRKTL
jgi:hypothetical protein